MCPSQCIEWRVHRDSFRFTEASQLRLRPIELWLCPGLNGAFSQCQTWIWNYQIEIETDGVAEALTGRTCSEGIIETEQARLRRGVNRPVIFAFEAFGKVQALGTRASGAL